MPPLLRPRVSVRTFTKGAAVKELIHAYIRRHGEDPDSGLLDLSFHVAPENVFIFIDDERGVKPVSLDTPLRNGDVVVLASPVAGG